jgi:glutamyl-tRNA synthetase
MLAWLFARSDRSRFLLRIDDLDRRACRPEVEESQMRDLQELGLEWDGPPVRQSDRGARHQEAIAALVSAGRTYLCYCTRREVQEAAQAPHGPWPEGAYPGTCRDLDAAARAAREASGRRPALRLRAGGAVAAVHDRLHGRFEGPVDDFVIRRNDGTPAYNLAVVIDDADAGVDEVVRGADLLETTPRQVHLARLLGLPVPVYAHVPLVLGADGRRLAKRHGGASVADRAGVGGSADDVRAVLAGSLGLARPGERVTMATVLRRFDPEALPHEPWALPSWNVIA